MDIEISNFTRNLNDIKYFNNFDCNWSKPYIGMYSRVKNRKRFDPIKELDDKEFKHKYRFTKKNMLKIIDLVRDDLVIERTLETRRNQVPIKLQIMAAIRFWGATEHFYVTAMIHGITVKTLSKICKRVSAALAAKASRYIRMPSTLAEKEKVANDFQSLTRMPQIIGALSYINIRFQVDELNKGKTILTQIVSDASFKIRDIDCKLMELKENNIVEIFGQSRIKERFEQNEFRGRILLGDARLWCNSYMFTSVQTPSVPAEFAFNRAHAIILSTAESFLNLWRKRFAIIDSVVQGSYNTCRHTIVALALLHNMAIEWNDHIENTYKDKSASVERNQESFTRTKYIKNYF